MRPADVLFVDLLGGIGDLVMALPAIHGLAASHPGARLRVVTHEPGAGLLRGDPAVGAVRVAEPGGERAAVAAALAERRPDLAVTTTRYGGIPDLLRASAARAVTDLWRGPPPDELVTGRYLRILAAEGVLDMSTVDPVPRLWLSAAERADGARVLAALLGGTRRRPVVLVRDAGMAVKLWPERRWTELTALLDGLGIPTVTPPRLSLRRNAAVFAEVGRRGGVVVGGDTGPLRVAAASGARTVALFGPTLASRYGLGAGSTRSWARSDQPGLSRHPGPKRAERAHEQSLGARDLQGLPGCPHRRPTAITTQVCWWHADCPLSPTEPACMADIPAAAVAEAVIRSLA